MKKNKLKSIGLMLIALTLPFFGVQAFDALTVHSTNGTNVTQIELDKIQRITFSDNAVAVKNVEGVTALFAFEEFLRITFEPMEEDQTFVCPVISDLDVIVYISFGNLVAVSTATINSMTLFSIDGRVIQRIDASRMFVGHLPASVYLLQVNTEQGSFMRKIIKQ